MRVTCIKYFRSAVDLPNESDDLRPKAWVKDRESVNLDASIQQMQSLQNWSDSTIVLLLQAAVWGPEPLSPYYSQRTDETL